MKPKTFMLIAGEASGDQLAAELVLALREKLPDAKFFGTGGAKMTLNGVELVHDMSQLAILGITDVIRKIFEFKRLLKQLLAQAIERQPDVIIGIDYGGFNLRFARMVKEYVRQHPGGWNPKTVQFVSPQVWGSRPKRANRMVGNCDLLLSIFPFEKDWYAQRVPELRVEFIGHPMVDRFSKTENRKLKTETSTSSPQILLLPGSRQSELKLHLPAMLGALKLIQEKIPSAIPVMVVPSEKLLGIIVWEFAKRLGIALRLAGPPTLEDTRNTGRRLFPNFDIQIGDVPAALARADVAISKTGTVTMECAFFRVPTVTFFKGSWLNYQIASRIVTVKTFTMPNLLAGEEVFPEFLQYTLTPENLARATLELLQSEPRRAKMQAQLDKIITSLGGTGATKRAAAAILTLLK